MFSKFVNKITDRVREENNGEASTGTLTGGGSLLESDTQHGAEGFLCPPCMRAFPSAEALEEHYNSIHLNNEPSFDSQASSRSNEETHLLRQELLSLQTSFAEEKIHSHELRQQIQNLQAEAQLTENLDTLSQFAKENDTLSKKIEELVATNEEMKTKMSSLQDQLLHKNSTDDAEVLRHELVNVQRLMDQVSLEKEGQQEKFTNPSEAEVSLRNALEKEKEISKNKSEELVQMKVNSTKALEAIKKELEDTKKGYAEKEQAIKRYEAAITESKANKVDSESQILILQKQTVDARSARNELENKFKSSESQTLLLQKQIDEACSAKSDLEKKFKSSESQLLLLQKQTIDVRSAKKELENKLKLSESQTLLLQKQIEEACSAKSELEKKFNASESQKLLLQKETNEACIAKNDLENKLKSSEEERSVLLERCRLRETEAEEFRRTIKNMQVQLDDTQAAFQELERENQSLQVESAKLKELEHMKKSYAEKEQEIKGYEAAITEIKANQVESESKLLLLQTQTNEACSAKNELEKKFKSSEEEKSLLLERCLLRENEADEFRLTIKNIQRKLDDTQAALQELGRENQSLQMESAKLQGRKWTDDSIVNSCSTCEKEFTLTIRKHHCRHCGQIFCNDCSSRTAAVPSCKKPARVCDSCYQELLAK